MRPKKTHGLSKHPLCSVWIAMRDRCNNPKHKEYHRYGGRGISVCTEWLDPGTFLKWAMPKWKKGLQIDRIDNNKGYSPDNCRFVTSKVNNNNTEVNKEAKKRAKLIRTKYIEGITIKELAEKYNRGEQQICIILRNEQCIDPDYIVPESIKRKWITQEIADKIRAGFAGGLSRKELMAKYNITYNIVGCILRGETWNSPALHSKPQQIY